ncbi:hypothetical protein [Shewanella sp. YLB-07]|uniref:hypothetical protein n=1 Tax=Shewanella sp. YLB-07 TaxID=2601268 RepID=UPI00128CA3B7|nr:hypothetical protein [Shewanella sp. YLB-07]MPY24358.1 hypothetical protein [Shewanella sp. YLB-07]
MLKYITAIVIGSIFFSKLVLASANQVSIPQTTAILTVSNPSEVIQIRNKQESVAYVQAQVVEVFIAPDGKERFETIDKDKKANGVVAIPEKFIVAPLGSSSVRLLFTGDSHSTSDRFFKIRFTPIIKSKYYGDSSTDINSTIFVSITGSTFAVVPKVSPAPQITKADKPNAIELTNSGDSIVLLNNCKLCIGSICELSSQKRLISKRTVLFSMNNTQVGLSKNGQFSCETLSSTQSAFIEYKVKYNNEHSQ